MADETDLPAGSIQTDPGDEVLTRTITAILAADVAGFSRMVADDEEGTLRRMAEYGRIFKEAVTRHKGRVFNTAGDAILAEFPSAVAAMRAALEVQEAHQALNENLSPPERLQFRMGINVGDVVQQDGDLLGDGVNIAARLEGLAEPGGIAVSRSVHDAVGNKVPAGYRPLGRQRLKNIAQPVEVYRVRLQSDTRKERSSRAYTMVFVPLVALLLAGGGLAWYFQDKLRDVVPFLKPEKTAAKPPAKPRTALAVTVARPGQQCFKDVVRITGRFVPHREVEVRPDTDGVRVTRVLVKPLAEVTAGQTLAQVVSALPDAPAVAIRSPVAGVVGKSTAMVDMPAGASARPLFTIIADGKLDFAADVPAEGLETLASGQNAEIRALGSALLVTGRVNLVSKAVDPATQFGRATISVDPNRDLRWGMFGRGTVQVGESCGLTVPNSSVMYDGDAAVVFVSANGLIEARPVVTGPSSSNDIQIRSGLAAADQVVQRAGPFLREGDRITAITGGPRSAERQ